MPGPRLIALLLLAAAPAARAADAPPLRIDPPDVTLTGPRAFQGLRLFGVRDGRAVADHADGVAWTSSDPKVAAVSADGTVTPAGNGRATVRGTVDGRSAEVAVEVRDFAKPDPVRFIRDVQPTLTRAGCNMGACHGALAGKGGFKLSLRGYDPESDHFTLTRQALARRVDTAKPGESLLLTKAVRAVPHGGGTRFDDDSDHYKLLSDWIAAGAPGPDAAEAAVVKLEVFPKALLGKPGDKFRLSVRATYADGRRADVTRWAKYATNNESAAAVDEEGFVTLAGRGEAGVSAIFTTQVAVATATAPYDAPKPAVADGTSPVDRFIAEKLRLLNIPPSAAATDAEFARRVHLDVIGVLPSPAELDAYAADPSPDKRAKLVASLLTRPEYVDYWTYRWSDLLLVSTRKLPAPAMWSMSRAVRRAVAENHGWDRFAREILTSSGSTLRRGGGGYFVMHKDVTELAESTALTFLGMSIGCAKCHNHPLEKWTQDQYWAFANLFSRVGLKNGERAGEVLVVSLPGGDAPHPRLNRPVSPAPLDGTPMPAGSADDRRDYFAKWLTDPKNPFFARAAVNRVWRALMGRGLVESEDDLRDTNPASHPELLDWLTADFIAHGYDVKHLIAVIAATDAYARSSKPLPGNAADDRFYSHYLPRRLSAEVILDAYSDVTGVATPFNRLSLGPTGGEKQSGDFPAGTRAMQLPDSLLISQFLDTFGRAEREQTCSCERSTEGTVTQALHLNNGQTLNTKLRDGKSRAALWAAEGAPPGELVGRAFRLCLGREPTPTERARFEAALAEGVAAGPQGRREAVEDLFWALLTGKEFLFNH